MANDTTEDQVPPSATAAADDGKNNNNRKNGKRRLSKRERKNLKKQKTSAAAATNTTDAASTSTEKHEPSQPSQTLQQPSTKKTQPTLLEEEYQANYIPAPSVKIIAQENSDSKSLGKWFPKASVIKSSVSYGNDYLAKLAKEKKKQQQQQKKNNNTPNNNCSDEATATTVIKEPKASLVLFYQYVNPTWSNAKVDSFLTYLTNIAQTHRTNIGGRIRVSTEGINATVSAASRNDHDNHNDKNDVDVDAEFEAAQTLRHFTKDLQNFDPVAFADTDFKYIDGLTADRHFKELKLLPVKELVFYGIREGDCVTTTTTTTNTSAAADGGSVGAESGGGGGSKKEVKGGVHLEAKEYHEMLKRNDAVVIDVRNHYEAAIGRFDGQMADTKKKSDEGGGGGEGGGATYIDPKMRKSTDFTSWLAEEETKQKLEGKTVMMFCTGGIRCERASAYLNSQIGNKVKGVYQLKGGIERYLKEFPEGGFWRGKNFVFDKREAISAGNVNGDGGVVRKQDASSSSSGKKEEEEKMLEWGAECAKCKKPWDRYIGKRKCYTCGVPVLVCDNCMSQSSSMKKKKKGTAAAAAAVAVTEDNDSIRCPLCVAEGVTVPAEDVEWTDNGVRGRLRTSSFSEGGGGEDSDKKAPAAEGTAKQTESKAAKSVLKWGGGHAKKKRDQRSWSRRPCQFGADCVRKDCFFYHPERESKSRKET